MAKKSTIYTLEFITKNPENKLQNGDIIEYNGGYRSDGWMMVYNCDDNGRYNIAELDRSCDDYGAPIQNLSIILDVPIDFWDNPIRIGDPEGAWHSDLPVLPLDMPRLRATIGIPNFTEDMIKIKKIHGLSYKYIKITYNGKKYTFYHNDNWDVPHNILDRLNSDKVIYIYERTDELKKRWIPI